MVHHVFGCRLMLVAALIPAILIAGCMAMMPMSVPTASVPRSQASYKPVDFRKWASGMYADEYVGRYVVVDGYYIGGMGAMSQGANISFGVKSMSAGEMVKASQRDPMALMERSHENVMVLAPLSMRDQIFPLKTDQRIRVYGQAINSLGRSVFTRQVTSSVLYVAAHRIETF